MEDERDAEDAIRRLDRIEFGKKGRRIRVEWTKVCLFFYLFNAKWYVVYTYEFKVTVDPFS